MSGDRAPIRVLTVDDDRAFAELTRDVLERQDERFDVSVATAASEGIERLAETDFDCVVSDFEMAPVDGLAFLKEVRADDADIPFILFTGKGSEEVASEAITAGVTDYLHKSTGTDQYTVLANRISNVVDRYRAERTIQTERDRFVALFENAPDPIYEVDLSSGEPILQAVNPAFESIFGHEEPDVIGKTVAEVIVPDDHASGHEDIVERVLAGEYVETDVERTAADGRRTFRLRVVPFGDDDPPLEAYARYTDVTEQKRRERRLQAERDRVQALFENTSEAIAYMEWDGDDALIRSVNPAFEAAFGYEESEIVGAPIDDLIVPDSEREEGLEINRRVRRGEPVECEVRRRTADGIEEFVHRSVPLHPGREGEGGFAMYRSISDRIRREREIEEEREKYQTLVEKSNDGIVVIQGRAFVTVNRQFADLLGVDEPATLEGTEYLDFVAPEYRERVLERYDARLAGDAVPARYDIEVVTTDGERVPVELNMSVIDYEGEPADMAVVRDIRERRNRERALSELHRAAAELERADTRQAVFQALIDAADDILDFALVAVDEFEDGALVQRAWTIDRDTDGYFERTPIEEDTLATRTYRRGETVVADDLRELDITPADPEYLSALTVPIGHVGTFQTVSREVGAFDETDRELAELLAGHALAAVHRIDNARSLRRQRERLRRENERLDAFASFVSHDLRNPLNVARGRLEMAREDCDSEDLDRTEGALVRMSDIIGDVLTWAREGQHVDADEREPVPLAPVVAACWRTVETERATIDVRTDRTVLGEERRLQHVFENLFRNAVEHAGEAVTIEVGVLPDGFYVEDDGPGIPESLRETVFEYGYSVPQEGTGFGLAIVKEIVEAHGWTVRATGSDAGGARIEVHGVEFAD